METSGGLGKEVRKYVQLLARLSGGSMGVEIQRIYQQIAVEFQTARANQVYIITSWKLPSTSKIIPSDQKVSVLGGYQTHSINRTYSLSLTLNHFPSIFYRAFTDGQLIGELLSGKKPKDVHLSLGIPLRTIYGRHTRQLAPLHRCPKKEDPKLPLPELTVRCYQVQRDPFLSCKKIAANIASVYTPFDGVCRSLEGTKATRQQRSPGWE
jgi:hypothetical protein